MNYTELHTTQCIGVQPFLNCARGTYDFGTLALDGWPVTFGTVRTGMSAVHSRASFSLLDQI